MNMKNLAVLLMVILGVNSIFAQNSKNNGYISDNFSLEGALQIFKQSNSLEEFEKALNDENNNVNNLDLNNDGFIDYLTVNDYQDKNIHVIAIGTFLSDRDRQDIATIEVERKSNDVAIIQIVGDEDLFGENVFVEPYDIDERLERSKGGPNAPEIVSSRIVVNVWGWSIVRFIFSPRYVLWVSPYRWSYYPRWWKPWRPYQYTVFVDRCAYHRHYYHYAPVNRIVYAHNVYEPHRYRSNYYSRNEYNHYERRSSHDRIDYQTNQRQEGWERQNERSNPRNNGRDSNYKSTNQDRQPQNRYEGRKDSNSRNRGEVSHQNQYRDGDRGNNSQRGRRH